MNIPLLIILGYCILNLVTGFIIHRNSDKSRGGFYLAGRSLSGLLFFFTMAATNFSAFTIFGLSGAGYRIGYAFYPVMGFATGFMALGIYLIGSRILEFRKGKAFLTPSDFILDRYKSPFLKYLVSLILIIFTLPYIAIQTIAAGNAIAMITGLPYLAGAALIMFVVILYVSMGGLKSIAWTDALQIVLMFILSASAFIIIVRNSGGWSSGHNNAFRLFPALYSRPGLDNSITGGVWFGYFVLWFLSVPLMPQMFQRYFAVKDRASLKTTVVLYPVITTLLFFFTVSIGVLGKGIIPDLPAAKSDSIFPILLSRFVSPGVSALLLTGSLAAIMSTLDSQLLTLTSILRCDFIRTPQADKYSSKKLLLDKGAVILIGTAGFLISLKPPETLLSFINATTFPGLSVLAPAVFGGLYWKKGNSAGAAASIIAGEILVVLYYFKLLPSFGFLPVVPIALASAVIYIAVSLISEKNSFRKHAEPFFAMPMPFADRDANFKAPYVFLTFLVLGNETLFPKPLSGLFLSIPLWVWYYAILGLLLSLACYSLLPKE